jgi:hypothetical protein
MKVNTMAPTQNIETTETVLSTTSFMSLGIVTCFALLIIVMALKSLYSPEKKPYTEVELSENPIHQHKRSRSERRSKSGRSKSKQFVVKEDVLVLGQSDIPV